MTGRITATAAFHVGGRLVALGEDGTVVRLEPGGSATRSAQGSASSWARPPGPAHSTRSPGGWRPSCCARCAATPPADPSLWLTDPLPALGQLDGLVFSGGVAEYVYGTETRAFGDLGPRLGGPLSRRPDRPGGCRSGAAGRRADPGDGLGRIGVHRPAERHHQLPERTRAHPAPAEPAGRAAALRPSGQSTRRRRGGDPAPRRPVRRRRGRDSRSPCTGKGRRSTPVARPRRCRGAGSGRADRRGRDALPDARRRCRAHPRRAAPRGTRDHERPRGHRRRPLRDFDYVDLGRVRQPSGTVPVTIKSLVFGQ